MKSSSSLMEQVFAPRYFNDSEVNNIFLTKESALIYLKRNAEEHKETYNRFDELFTTQLQSMSDNFLIKYVSNVFQKKIVYIGSTRGTKNDIVFVRSMLDGDKLSGLVLDASILDINLMTGETPYINDCIYAVYYGLIRSAIVTNKDEIRNDVDLHKLITQFIYHIVLRSTGKRTIYTTKQKIMILAASIYIYYRHFLLEKHPAAISMMKKYYKQIIGEENFPEIEEGLSRAGQYSSMKDLPKILIDMNVFNDSPGVFTVSLLKFLGNIGIYCFIGPLDQLISMIILCQYPTELFQRSILTMDGIHKGIETVISKYIDKLKYSNL